MVMAVSEVWIMDGHEISGTIGARHKAFDASKKFVMVVR